MLIAEGIFPHISQLDGALRACVHEPITALRVELCSSDHFGQLLHVGGFYIDNVEALILYVEIPKINPQVITANESLAVAVDRYAIDVVGMSICIISTRNRGNNCVVMGKAWEFQGRGIFESGIGIRSRCTPTTMRTARCGVNSAVVLCYNFQGLLEDFP